jgi:hypothetical protein
VLLGKIAEALGGNTSTEFQLIVAPVFVGFSRAAVLTGV